MLFATPDTWVGRLLGLRPFVGLGLVSYSAYLWHQPLFAFAKQRLVEPPGSDLLLALGVAGFGLTYLSWRFVEAPFRNRQRFDRRAIAVLGLSGSAAFAAIGISGAVADGFPSREPVFNQLAGLRTVIDSRCHGPQRRSAAQVAAGDVCTLGDAATPPSFAVLGDSHAGALVEALGRSAAQRQLAFQAVSSGFGPPLGAGCRLNRLQDKDCLALMNAALDRVKRDARIHTVVLFAEWANYATGHRDEGGGGGADSRLALASDELGSARVGGGNAAVFRRALTRTVAALQAAGKHVVLVEPVPEFSRNVLPAVFRQLRFNDGVVHSPVMTTAEYDLRNREVFDAFAALRGVRAIRTREIFCTAGACRATGADGVIWFSDTNHLTEPGGCPLADAVLRVVAGDS